jgi:hypothetical protein
VSASVIEAEYAALLAPYLKPGFVFRELVNGTQNHAMPPKSMWPRIIRPLQLANLLRDNMMMNYNAKGLLLQAGFRPKGGATTSQHKYNRALDLDLFPSDYHLAGKFATEAVRLFCKYGETESLGLGLYGRKGSCATIRVHLDVGKHETIDRGWQIVGGREYGLKASDIPAIAKLEGLQLPGMKAGLDE